MLVVIAACGGSSGPVSIAPAVTAAPSPSLARDATSAVAAGDCSYTSNEAQWQSGDHTVLCVVTSDPLQPFSGSVRGTNRRQAAAVHQRDGTR